ncbi:MAG: hypothetical protein WD669_05685 [Pirellulales bacterium]
MRAKGIGSGERGGFGRLEVLLVLAFLALLFQVFPSLWFGTWRLLDVRNWPRGAWMFLNVAVVLALFAIRFGPDLMNDWQQRQARRKDEHEKHEKQRQLKEQKQLFERMKEARKRRLY